LIELEIDLGNKRADSINIRGDFVDPCHVIPSVCD
jgi:hypothetical protein